MASFSPLGAGLVVGGVLAAIGFTEFRAIGGFDGSRNCAAENFAALDDLDASNARMKGLAEMTQTQACQLFSDRIAILNRLRECSGPREASSWKAESAFYQKARQGRCG